MATFAQNFKVTDNKFQVPTPVAGGSNQALTDTSATQNYPLGTRVQAWDPVLGFAEFIYAKGVALTVAGESIQLNPDGTTTRSATPKGKVGVAMSANVANQFGWYCVAGRCVAKIGEDIAANSPAYMSATAGTLQDTVIAGSHVIGMVLLLGLNAGGSAIPGTVDTTAAGTTVAWLTDPYCAAAV